MSGMAVIAPIILSTKTDEYKAAVEHFMPFAKRVHIDISDGVFAPRQTVGIGQLWWPQSWTVDIHAMVARPSVYVEKLIKLRPSTIIFHAEVKEDLIPVLQQVKQAGIHAGVALQRTTVPETVASYIETADYVSIVSGKLGEFGGKARMMQLEKIRLVRAIHPRVEIGWDGGVTVDNVFHIAQGGADVISVGGAINHAKDPQATYNKLLAEMNRQSVI
jgi:ribulose-phosphate 3-epimerase